MPTLRLAALLAAILAALPALHAGPVDPLFDFDAIANEPLDAVTLSTTESDGIVIERFEFTSATRTGAPDRVSGILAYPKGAARLPAVFWSQAGMSAANDYFPKVFAKKGYACLNITLPHPIRNSQAPFDTRNPREANLTRLAIDQMRAITYLASRPEADPDRIGIGGSSYGGFFASLIAGADPRIKAGFAFFAGGRHDLGTNLPQFTGMKTADDVEIWLATIDPAWRLARHPVPFLWAASANDNWFHLPAVAATFEQAAGDCRLAIMPRWQHGFPEHVDAQLVDWLDIWLAGTRTPYNKPGALRVYQEDGRLMASWDWTGDNPVAKAELVVSYGPVRPWHGWVQRHHEAYPARIEGSTATADVPVPRTDLELYVYGNITDANGVVMSTLPLAVNPAALGVAAPAPMSPVNCFPIGGFEPEDITFLKMHGFPAGTPDSARPHAGTQSLRFDPGTKLRLQLWHVPSRNHRLSLHASGDAGAALHVKVDGLPPQNWKSSAVDLLRRRANPHPDALPTDLPAFTLAATPAPSWTPLALPCPLDERPVEGYTLTLSVPADAPGPVWVDTIRFEPDWN